MSSAEGYTALLRLVERGAKVKAAGFGRVDECLALRQTSSANPASLMFGTDLPGTRAPRPFARADLDLLAQTLDEEIVTRCL